MMEPSASVGAGGTAGEDVDAQRGRTGYDADLDAEWKEAAVPSGAVVHVRLLELARRQGWAAIATRIPSEGSHSPSQSSASSATPTREARPPPAER